LPEELPQRPAVHIYFVAGVNSCSATSAGEIITLRLILSWRDVFLNLELNPVLDYISKNYGGTYG